MVYDLLQYSGGRQFDSDTEFDGRIWRRFAAVTAESMAILDLNARMETSNVIRARAYVRYRRMSNTKGHQVYQVVGVLVVTLFEAVFQEVITSTRRPWQPEIPK